MTKIKIDIVKQSTTFLNDDGTFDKFNAIKLGGQYAGECYDKEGFDHILKESEDKTLRRVDRTINSGHHSVYDHLNITFNIQNLPKMLAMVLNNEHQYTTSEKSARYTPVQVKKGDLSFITSKEEELYEKWLKKFQKAIKDSYGKNFDDGKIVKLAQENARYLVTVFMPTQMIYTTSLRQINYIASWMLEYIRNINPNSFFDLRLSLAMHEFVEELRRLNVLDSRLLKNEKHRSISIFGKDLDKNNDIFANVYSTVYEGSFAQYAQAHRHRTLDYQLEFLKQAKFFIPPIIASDEKLVKQWIRDMKAVKEFTPQGQMVRILETGTYDNFILKCKERLCSAAQLEIANQTKETLTKYYNALVASNSYLAEDMEKYTHGARCTFPDFDCSKACGFAEGVSLTRKI